jgi:hypothetical protein
VGNTLPLCDSLRAGRKLLGREIQFPFRNNCPNLNLSRMPSSGILRRVALVKTDISEERSSASIITVTRIGELGQSNLILNLSLQ